MSALFKSKAIKYCYDLNGKMLFENEVDFSELFNVEFSYFSFVDEGLLSVFNYDRKNIIFF